MGPAHFRMGDGVAQRQLPLLTGGRSVIRPRPCGQHWPSVDLRVSVDGCYSPVTQGSQYRPVRAPDGSGVGAYLQRGSAPLPNPRDRYCRPRAVLRALLLVAVGLGIPSIGLAQSRWSVGGTLAVARFVDFDPETEAPGPLPRIEPWLEPAFGMRLSRQVMKRVSIDGEATMYPRYIERQTPGEGYHGFGKIALASGATFALTRGRPSIYVAARGGLMRFGRVPAILAADSRGRATVVADSFADTFWALDVGGGIAWPVSTRYRMRVEAADKIVWFAPEPLALNPTFVRHLAHVAVGLDFSF